MTEYAVVSFGTLLSLFYQSADLGRIVTPLSATVVLVVEEHAVFVVVRLFFRARGSFEHFQVQFHHFGLLFLLGLGGEG